MPNCGGFCGIEKLLAQIILHTGMNYSWREILYRMIKEVSSEKREVLYDIFLEGMTYQVICKNC